MFFYILMSTSLSFALPRFDSQRISFSPPLAAMLFLCISLLDVANLHHFNAAQLKTIPCLAVSPRNDSIRSTAQPSQTKSILCLCCPQRCFTSQSPSSTKLRTAVPWLPVAQLIRCSAQLRSATPWLLTAQLSFAVAMIIRSIHFRCCAMRIRAIPSPFQRKTALRVSVADQRISLLFHCRAVRG